MNKNTFFSVIVASYNYESYIQETLLSLANQTYKNFEVIVVDDGSKDNSIKIIQDICAQYPNFKLYTHPHNQNKGLKDTILLGLAKAKGDFIAFCESDDYWSEDHLKEVNSAINKNPNVALVSNYLKIFPFNKNIDDYVQSCRQALLKPNKTYYTYLIVCNIFCTFSALAIKKDVLLQCDFNSYVPAWLDYWLLKQILIKHKAVFIDKVLTYWRIHEDSYNKREDNQDLSIKFHKKLRQLLFKRAPISFLMKEVLTLKNIFTLDNFYHKNIKYKRLKILGFSIKFKILDKKIIKEIENSIFWDENYYKKNYKIKKNALMHYLKKGWKLGYNPSQHFNTNEYLKLHHKCTVNPLYYFITQGIYDDENAFEKNLFIPDAQYVEKYVNSSKNKDKVIYTCITGNYDELINHYYINNDYKYVCFTDNKDLISNKKYGIWEILPIKFSNTDNSLINRWHKMHPHLLFPNIEESIYIDSNINILSNKVFEEIEKTKNNILLPKHFNRNCIYKEIEKLKNIPKFNTPIMQSKLQKVKEFLEEYKFPKNFGLGENNLLYRRHNDKLIIHMMEDWWNLIQEYIPRDQLFLMYLFYKYELNPQEHFIENLRCDYKNSQILLHKEFINKKEQLICKY